MSEKGVSSKIKPTDNHDSEFGKDQACVKIKADGERKQ